MAKIHTHYDNLKVSRGAPQEVVRAAYKALSQKYHPDKNPGDAKAARIMAILNSAYGTLSDPQRRREHDEWIAAEEWEIAWLESTQSEDSARAEWEPEAVEQPAVASYRRLRDPSWWLTVIGALALGVIAGIVLVNQTAFVSDAMRSALGARAATSAAAQTAPRGDPLLEGWAVNRDEEEGVLAPDIKVVALSHVVIPARAPDCDRELRGLAAPTGEGWPDTSGYLGGFPVENVGSGVQIVIDNGANLSPVLVKVVDSARGAVARHIFLQAGASMTVDNLASGRYEVRYQNLEVGGSTASCIERRQQRQATGAESP